MGLTNLGIFHTIIGIIALGAAIVSYVKYGKINLTVLSGKIYFYLTIVTSLTALGISKLGGFNPGHVGAILVIIVVVVAFFLSRKKKGNNRARYYENFLLSFSFFFSWLPTVVETFTRVPVGHPLAKGPGDPVITRTLLTLFILFILGSILQFRKQRKINLGVTS